MQSFKPLMFAALAGLPLAVLPAMAATTDSTTTTTTNPAGVSSTTTTQDGTTYSQSTMTPAHQPPQTHPSAVSGGGEGGSGGSGK